MLADMALDHGLWKAYCVQSEADGIIMTSNRTQCGSESTHLGSTCVQFEVNMYIVTSKNTQ